ncbi:hypothetical protein FIBSPDRAFT_847618, partial [Athelia psychrophila]
VVMAHNWWAVDGTAVHEIMVLGPEWERGGLADARAGWCVSMVLACARMRRGRDGTLAGRNVGSCAQGPAGDVACAAGRPDSQPEDKEVTPDM